MVSYSHVRSEEPDQARFHANQFQSQPVILLFHLHDHSRMIHMHNPNAYIKL